MPNFPACRGRELLAAVKRLGYTVTRQSGSHRTMEAPGRPRLLFSFHDNAEVPPGLVRKVLVRDIGLDVDTALDILKG
ncbi:type II toxin-antitoxin system HicA family toxin [Blastococcus sp. CT_GayMR20]|nr:type II toxin-antitoxin system HicA family toxin [Blastococcus sp. CT_GayMR20]